MTAEPKAVLVLPSPPEAEAPPGLQRPVGSVLRLSAQIAAALTDDRRLIFCASPRGQEGCSSAVSRIGVGLASLGLTPVLLLDAQYRAPTLHAWWRLREAPGFAEALRGEAPVDDAVLESVRPGLFVLPCGRCDAASTQALDTDALPQILSKLRDRFRVVLLNAPPFLAAPESVILASRADAAVAVVARDETRRKDLAEFRLVLDGLRVPPIGFVIVDRSAHGPSEGHES